jgi:hypothetical protein
VKDTCYVIRADLYSIGNSDAPALQQVCHYQSSELG